MSHSYPALLVVLGITSSLIACQEPVSFEVVQYGESDVSSGPDTSGGQSATPQDTPDGNTRAMRSPMHLSLGAGRGAKPTS